MEEIIITFNNTHEAMACEDFFNNKKFNFTIMPTPTEITKSCGISIRVSKEIIDKVLIFNKESKITVKNIYLKQGKEYKILENK